MKAQKKIFFENLDGIRFFCFLSVFFFHAFHTDDLSIKSNSTYNFIKHDVFGNGNLGVNFFFVLSGFLITFLLIEEKKSAEKIHIGKFWLRRMLRIWPLFYFCVFFGFIIFPWVKSFFGEVSNENANPVFYLTFTNNFDFILKGLPDSSVLGVLWSVAIEEQFYFLWPIVLAIIPMRYYWFLFVFIIIASCAFISTSDYTLKEYHTLSCMGDLATGAFGAWLVHFTKLKGIMKNTPKIVVILSYILLVAVFLWRDELLYNTPIIRFFERELIAILFLFIILEQNYSINSMFKVGKIKWISKLGVRTYGLYCLHFIGILIAIKITAKLHLNGSIWHVIITETLLSLIITITIALISYKFFEKPFLRLKSKNAVIQTGGN